MDINVKACIDEILYLNNAKNVKFDENLVNTVARKYKLSKNDIDKLFDFFMHQQNRDLIWNNEDKLIRKYL